MWVVMRNEDDGGGKVGRTRRNFGKQRENLRERSGNFCGFGRMSEITYEGEWREGEWREKRRENGLMVCISNQGRELVNIVSSHLLKSRNFGVKE